MCAAYHQLDTPRGPSDSNILVLFGGLGSALIIPAYIGIDKLNKKHSDKIPSGDQKYLRDYQTACRIMMILFIICFVLGFFHPSLPPWLQKVLDGYVILLIIASIAIPARFLFLLPFRIYVDIYESVGETDISKADARIIRYAFIYNLGIIVMAGMFCVFLIFSSFFLPVYVNGSQQSQSGTTRYVIIGAIQLILNIIMAIIGG